MIIWGSKGRITSSNVDEILEKACPNCGHDLVLSDLKKWFTLYFIPIFPYSHIETLFHCKECDSSYKEEARNFLQGSKQDRAAIEKQAQKMMAITITACMTHMAKIDGNIDPSEKEVIMNIAKHFPQLKKEVQKTFMEISKSKDNEQVYQMLRQATTVLTAEGIMAIIGQVAEVLLADGKIDPKEEELLKEYMLIAGVPKNLYKSIIQEIIKVR